ncbi:RDD family protein [Streptomyces sp. NPDC001380]|uniref:RDD family protein n=1 Tax=Streptomyces sp. NPDC001380 TaxID=3364566 RepID=UPI0036B87FEA
MSYPPASGNPYEQPAGYGQAPQGQPYDASAYAYPQGQPQAGYPAYPQGGYYGGQPQPVLAHWGLRAGSFVIDWLITFGPYAVLAGTGRAVGGGTGALLTLVGLLTALGLGLFVCRQEGTTGQSPGKKVVGTRVLREADGQVIGFGAAFGRRLLHIVDGIPCYLGYLWPIWDEKKQTFSDKIMKTVVIRSQ